jgi:hypothetical protein
MLSAPAAASSCDFVLQWDKQAIDDCIRELKSEQFLMQTRIQTLSAEYRVLPGHLCLLAQELDGKGIKGEATALVIADACAELKAGAAKAKARKPSPK